MSSKTFRVATQTEKIEFTLEWTGPDGNLQGQVFHCRPTVPLQLILDFADMSTKTDEDDSKSGVAAMEMVKTLYEAAIVKDEYPLFRKILDDPDTGIDIAVYSEIAGWLASEYTARPTGENSPNSSPPASSGKGLTAGASPTELTYFRPEQPVVTTSSNTGWNPQ
jgi:hypothetical protein